MSSREVSKNTLERLLKDPNTKFEFRGIAETPTRRGFYIACRLGLVSASFFIGSDPNEKDGNLFVERVG